MTDARGGVNQDDAAVETAQQFDTSASGGENGTKSIATHSKEHFMVQANRRMWAGVIVAALGAVLVSGQPGRVQAQEKKGGPAKAAAPIETKDLSLDQAHAILAAAVEKAAAINTKMDVAVVDAGGNLKAFVRMDGAWLGSIDISIKKAKTARYFDMPTGAIGELSQPGKPLYQIEVSN